MKLFFSIGLGFMALQLLSNRILFARQQEKKSPVWSLGLGFAIEVWFIVALIVHINS